MVNEFWVQASTRLITATEPDGRQVAVRELPDIEGFTDIELNRVVCKGTHRFGNTDWWHCEVGTNSGTEDWSEIHDRIDAMALARAIVTARRGLPTTKSHDVSVPVAMDTDDEMVMETQKRSVQDIAASHSFGTRGSAPGADTPRLRGT